MNTFTAAQQAGVTTATIRMWCRRGVVAAAKVAGRWVIEAASLAYRLTLRKRTMDPIATQYERITNHAADLFAAQPDLVRKGYRGVLTVPAHDDAKAHRHLGTINNLLMRAAPDTDADTQRRYGLLASAARDMQATIAHREKGAAAHAEESIKTVASTLDTYEAATR